MIMENLTKENKDGLTSEKVLLHESSGEKSLDHLTYKKSIFIKFSINIYSTSISCTLCLERHFLNMGKIYASDQQQITDLRETLDSSPLVSGT